GLASASPASADVHLPGVEGATPLGSGHVVALPDQRPTRKRVDGRIGDWHGSLPGFAGVTIYSRGELVYQDHLFDAYGPAADRDAAYFGLLDASGIEQLDPRTHRPTTTTYEFARDSEGYHYGASPFQ